MTTTRNRLKRVFGGMFAAAVLAGFMGIAGQASAAGNLVVNGSFELTSAGVTSPGAYICTGTNASCASGATSNVSNWTSSCNNNSCGNGNSVGSILFGGTGGSAFNGGIGFITAAQNSPDGGNFIGIDGDSTYTVSLQQVISGLTPGASYLVTFYQAAAQQAGSNTSQPTTDRWQVSLGGSAGQLSQLMTDTNGGFIPWTKQSLTFVADATSDVLKFMAIGTPSGVPPVSLLDGVSLSAVPEPSAWAVLVMGLVIAGLLKFRRPVRSAAA